MKVSFAAAGTAGHIEPALAVAHWLTKHPLANLPVECEFIGTSASLDSALLKENGFVINPVIKAPFPRRPTLGSLLWPYKFYISIRQINQILAQTDVVVGFGGYVCAPTYLVAKFKRIPIVIHEANVKPGMANNLGRRLGAILTIAFESTKDYSMKWKEAQCVGMPLRDSVKALASISQADRVRIRQEQCNQWGFDPERPIILVFGGSQGSRAINSVIAQILSETDRIGIQIVHALGRGNELPARSKNYLPLAYIADMPATMVASDFAITRGGAVTCAELGVLKTFGVIVPLSVGNGEQKFNAAELRRIAGAVIVEENALTPKMLSEKFFAYLSMAKEYRESPATYPFSLDAEESLGQIVQNLMQEKSKQVKRARS